MKKEDFDKVNKLFLIRKKINGLLQHLDSLPKKRPLGLSIYELFGNVGCNNDDIKFYDSSLGQYGSALGDEKTRKEMVYYCQKQARVSVEGIKRILKQARERIEEELVDL